MNAIAAKTPVELLEALTASNQVLEFVPRELLIETLGDAAYRFLPVQPEFISVNRENVLLTAMVHAPDLIKKVKK